MAVCITLHAESWISRQNTDDELLAMKKKKKKSERKKMKKQLATKKIWQAHLDKSKLYKKFPKLIGIKYD